jgi:hypothetical protein
MMCVIIIKGRQIIMIKKGEQFENFSKKLYGFLVMKGIRYETKYKHNDTGKWCWVYNMTDELSKALKEWGAQNPKK